jgi:hypothetical protein
VFPQEFQVQFDSDTGAGLQNLHHLHFKKNKIKNQPLAVEAMAEN